MANGSRTHRYAPRQIIHHTLVGTDGGVPSEICRFNMDGQAVSGTGTVNPGFPRAVRVQKVWMNTGTLAVTTPGNWTLGFHVNRAAGASSTFVFNPTTLDDVFSGDWLTPVVMQATDQYHILATGVGAGRTLMFIRAILEFEVI